MSDRVGQRLVQSLSSPFCSPHIGAEPARVQPLYGAGRNESSGTGLDSVQIAIHFFVNFDIFKWLYLAYVWVYLEGLNGVVESDVLCVYVFW